MAASSSSSAAAAAAATFTSRQKPLAPKTLTSNFLPLKSPHPKPSPLVPPHRRRPLPLLCNSLSSLFSDVGGDGDDDGDKPREECGVVGIIGDPEAASLAGLALHALQHRGQEGAGIVSAANRRLQSVTGLGLVSEVFTKPKLESLPGSSAIGHVRYSTAGAASSIANVQPFLAGYRFGQLALAHNGNLVNYSSLRSDLEDKGTIFNTTSDTEVILHLIAHSKLRPFIARLVEACEAVDGAYSLVVLTEDKLYAVRDPRGFRPLVMGRRRTNGAIVFASETCALDLLDAVYEREVNPGEVIEVDVNDLSITSMCLMPKRERKACIFEHIYFALPNSIVFGRAVYSSRLSFGELLAEESPVKDADVVIPVPDSGFFAALGYANKSGIPFQQGLIRSHYVSRTFIQPSQELRDLAVKLKLAPVPGVLNFRRSSGLESFSENRAQLQTNPRSFSNEPCVRRILRSSNPAFVEPSISGELRVQIRRVLTRILSSFVSISVQASSISIVEVELSNFSELEFFFSSGERKLKELRRVSSFKKKKKKKRKKE